MSRPFSSVGNDAGVVDPPRSGPDKLSGPTHLRRRRALWRLVLLAAVAGQVAAGVQFQRAGDATWAEITEADQ